MANNTFLKLLVFLDTKMTVAAAVKSVMFKLICYKYVYSVEVSVVYSLSMQ